MTLHTLPEGRWSRYGIDKIEKERAFFEVKYAVKYTGSGDLQLVCLFFLHFFLLLSLSFECQNIGPDIKSIH